MLCGMKGSAEAPPAQGQQQANGGLQLIYSPWTKLCQKGPEANAKQVCFTGKEGRLEDGRPIVSAMIVEQEGETRKVLQDCLATIGQVGNSDHENVTWGKAGRTRWVGKRPHNRGVSMNPVDHPHGGGEGKTSGGRHPVTPWGQPTRGFKTRNNKRTDAFIVGRSKKR